MFLSNHVATVLLLSQLPINPAFAFGVGLVSHYMLDMVPHGDNLRRFPPPKQDESIVDNPDYATLQLEGAVDIWTTAGVITLVGLFGTIKEPWTLLAISLGAVLPDFVMGINSIWKSKLIHYHQIFHYWLHIAFPDLPHKVGRATQVLYLIFILSLYFGFIG